MQGRPAVVPPPLPAFADRVRSVIPRIPQMVRKSSKTASYQWPSLLSTLRMYHPRARAFPASGSSWISYTVVSIKPRPTPGRIRAVPWALGAPWVACPSGRRVLRPGRVVRPCLNPRRPGAGSRTLCGLRPLVFVGPWSRHGPCLWLRIRCGLRSPVQGGVMTPAAGAGGLLARVPSSAVDGVPAFRVLAPCW